MIAEGAKEYIIGDAELERVQREYPVVWKNPNAAPKLCFVGCPHLSLEQLKDWTDKIEAGLENNGKKKVVIPTVLTAAPGVLEVFEKTEYTATLKKTGVITSSNKLRTYTSAKYYRDGEILSAITKKGK